MFHATTLNDDAQPTKSWVLSLGPYYVRLPYVVTNNLEPRNQVTVTLLSRWNHHRSPINCCINRQPWQVMEHNRDCIKIQLLKPFSFRGHNSLQVLEYTSIVLHADLLGLQIYFPNQIFLNLLKIKVYVLEFQNILYWRPTHYTNKYLYRGINSTIANLNYLLN